jgi:YD repeat-containing protein
VVLIRIPHCCNVTLTKRALDKPLLYKDRDGVSLGYSYDEKGKTLVYNNETERYDIEKDTDEFIAIVDFNTLKELVELIEKNI